MTTAINNRIHTHRSTTHTKAMVLQPRQYDVNRTYIRTHKHNEVHRTITFIRDRLNQSQAALKP